MEESKQKRKTPITTVSISQEYAKKLDEYLKGHGLSRKDFLELSIDYFLRTGFDIRGEAFDLSPLERIADRLESSAKVMEQHNEGTEVVRQLLEVVREQANKQLPAPDLIAHAAEEKARAEAKSQEQEKEIQRIKEENIRLRYEIECLKKWKDAARKELSRCKGIFSTANKNVLKELGI